jgi:hypothetical protein
MHPQSPPRQNVPCFSRVERADETQSFEDAARSSSAARTPSIKVGPLVNVSKEKTAQDDTPVAVHRHTSNLITGANVTVWP